MRDEESPFVPPEDLGGEQIEAQYRDFVIWGGAMVLIGMAVIAVAVMIGRFTA